MAFFSPCPLPSSPFLADRAGTYCRVRRPVEGKPMRTFRRLIEPTGTKPSMLHCRHVMVRVAKHTTARLDLILVIERNARKCVSWDFGNECRTRHNSLVLSLTFCFLLDCGDRGKGSDNLGRGPRKGEDPLLRAVGSSQRARTPTYSR